MLKMKVGFSTNPRLEPLIDGSVKPQNIDLDFAVMSPGELFYRNLMHDEFDLFEMSISEFLMVMANPQGSRWHWSALPIFPRKAFNWLNLCVHADAGIKSPADLKGKRIGVPDYPMTAALWMRIFFAELYGVQPSDLVWYIGRNNELSHGGALGLDKRPPAGVSLRWLTGDQTLDVMLDQGELDAAFWIVPPADPVARGAHNIDRYGGTLIDGNPKIRRLFPDGGRGIIAAYHGKTGVIPANHIVVIKRGFWRSIPGPRGNFCLRSSARKKRLTKAANGETPPICFLKGTIPKSSARRSAMILILSASSRTAG
jgi:4,5-dihydroxyphthalate decarboxylase